VELFWQLQAALVIRAILIIFCTANTDILRQGLPDISALGVKLLRKRFTVLRLVAVVTSALTPRDDEAGKQNNDDF
jgi:ABC-type Fe3+-siderophore transport system permease subunit